MRWRRIDRIAAAVLPATSVRRNAGPGAVYARCRIGVCCRPCCCWSVGFPGIRCIIRYLPPPPHQAAVGCKYTWVSRLLFDLLINSEGTEEELGSKHDPDRAVYSHVIGASGWLAEQLKGRAEKWPTNRYRRCPTSLSN